EVGVAHSFLRESRAALFSCTQHALPQQSRQTQRSRACIMIRFSCPRCKAVLESPDESAGAALTCPCGQRLEIPTPRPKTVPDAAPASRADYPANHGPAEWQASPPAPRPAPLPQADAT